MWQKLKPHYPLILILLLATAIRLVAVFKYGNFWDDEMFNFIYSQKSWPEGFTYWLWETNPPLHLLILKIWFYFFPAIEFFARLPSVLAGAISVYIIYRFTSEIFSKKIAYLAALYLAIHPYHIFWSATARVYAVYMMLALISVWLFYRLYFLEQNRRPRVAFAITNFFLIFAHLSSAFLLIGQFIALIIFKGKKSVIDWIKINTIPGLLGCAWIGASLYIKAGNDLGQAWFLNMAHSFKSSVNPVINILAGQYPFYVGVALIIVVVALLINILITKITLKDTRYLSLHAIILTPIALSAICNVWHIKFFMSILPLVILLIAEALSVYFNKTKLIASLIIFICLIGLAKLWQTLPLTDWSDVNNFYARYRADNTAFVYNNYILKTQIDRYLPHEIASRDVPLVLYDNMKWDDMVVKKNYLFTLLSDEQKKEWYKKNNFDNYDSIVLLQGEYNYMNNISNLLERNGWVLKEPPIRARLSGSYNLYYYEKNR